MHVRLKAPSEIEKLRRANLIVSDVLDLCQEMARPGVSTWDMEEAARSYIHKVGARSAFLNYQPSSDMTPYPAVLCTSRNEKVVHGIPGERVLINGDIVSVDCGCRKNGFYGDSAYTFAIGEVKHEILDLMKRTKESLYRAVDVAIAGRRVGDIGAAVQDYVESYGYSVVRELVGHGIGRELHLKPDVPNYGRRGSGAKLPAGLAICIEPMINLGGRSVVQEQDGWTIRTADRSPSAHFELTVVVQKEKADVLSTFRYIEEVLGPGTI